MASLEVVKFLVITVTRIGDTLFTIPAIRAIREANPNAIIDVLAHPNRYEVLQNLPYINKVDKITKKSAKFYSIFAHKKYDYALVYWYDKALIKYALTVADKVVAFEQDDSELNSKLYKAVKRPIFHKMHAIEEALLLPNALGFQTSKLRPEFHLTKDEKDDAQKLINETLIGAKPLIGLQVASFHTASYRDWPMESFYELCKRVISIYPNAKFALFGGKVEREKTEMLSKALHGKAITFAGKLTLRQTAAIMSKLDVYIGVDTGPTHIMSCFDIPMVAMYHANSLAKYTGPLQHPCAYLIDHPRGEVLDTNISMNEIGVDTVFENLQNALM